MSWASYTVKLLELGQTVKKQVFGRSMSGLVESGDVVTLTPIPEEYELKVDDIVLVKVNRNHYLHLIKDIKNGLYLIGNNKGRINGWVRKILYTDLQSR